MLDQFQPHATIAVSDLERAKGWYADKLGMKPTSEDMVERGTTAPAASSCCFQPPWPARPRTP